MNARLGSFVLDTDSLELSKAGRRIPLPAQSARLLALLVANAPQLVTREEIRRELWGDELHVEFDSAVNACISQIRSALHDNARAPRFIETVPRRGYRCLIERPIAAGPAEGEPRRKPLSVRWSAALAVFGAVVGALAWIAGPSARSTRSSSLIAMQKYERGVSGLADAAPQELLDRVRHFETAIAADPEFAAAYAGLADAKLMIGTYRTESPQIAFAAAKAAAQKALSLDSALADAHAAFGAAVLLFDWDWTGAREHLGRAVALNGRSSRAQYWWSRYLTAAGEHGRAIAAARRAVALAPGSPSALTQLGFANYYAGRFEDARSSCREASAVMPGFVPADTCVDAAVTPTGSRNWLMAPAIDFIRNGDRERAIEWLQSAANRHSDSVIFAGVEPALAPLKDDPRFMAVVRRVGGPVTQ